MKQRINKANGMNQWLVAGLLLGSLLVASGCSENNSPTKPPEIENTPPVIARLIIDSDSVKVSDSRSVEIITTDADDDSLTIAWTVTGGTIIGSGASVTWEMPETRGLYSIECTVSDERGGVVFTSREIEVSGWKLLFVNTGTLASTIQPGGVYSQAQRITYWKQAGYTVDIENIGNVSFTDSMLTEYDVVDIFGWLYAMSEDKGAAIHRWVKGGGNLMATITTSPMVPTVALFGVDRIDGNHGGSNGLDTYFHGAPLVIGPISGPEFATGYLGAESMDHPVLSEGNSLNIAASVGGYPAVVHGEFDYGAVVIVFAGGWSHDATKRTNAYRSTIYQRDNIKFFKNSISYLSK